MIFRLCNNKNELVSREQDGVIYAKAAKAAKAHVLTIGNHYY